MSLEKVRIRWNYVRQEWRAGFYVFKDCPECGRASVMGFSAKRCRICRDRRQAVIEAVSIPAFNAVKRAIARRQLMPAIKSGVVCVDCGASAQVYDHRLYAEPLQIEPVCRRCNILRGPALDSPARHHVA